MNPFRQPAKWNDNTIPRYLPLRTITTDSMNPLPSISRTHTQVGTTALLTAHQRAWSDIPYAKAIYAQLQKEAIHTPPNQQLAALLVPKFAPHFEAQYKLVEKLLEESGVDQILELGAGYTMRGMTMSQRLDTTYVELDQPEVIARKKAVLNELAIPIPTSFHLVAGNALNFNDLKKALSLLDPNKPVAIINEGLLRYFTFAEKEVLANHIYKIFQTQPGVWITPDISIKQGVAQEDKIAHGFSKTLQTISGEDFHKNLFNDTAHAKSFFEKLDFTITERRFMEMADDLVSPKAANISPSEVESVCGPWVAFIMKAQPHQDLL
jgi:O-methyltransferase involved in polyketide biosynthesis